MGPVRVRDFDEILARLKARGVYTIARIVVFKDDVLARYRRTWAVTDTRTGSLWLDGVMSVSRGSMLWNPRNSYTVDALAPAPTISRQVPSAPQA